MRITIRSTRVHVLVWRTVSSLLVGSMLTVAIVALSVLFVPDDDHSMPPSSVCVVDREDSGSCTLIGEYRTLTRSTIYIFSAGIGETQDRKVQSIEAAAPEWVPASVARVLNSHVDGIAFVEAHGWPLRASMSHGWAPRLAIRNATALPTRPLWAGLISNSVFWGVACLSIWSAGTALRSGFLRLQGRCRECGYALDGLPSARCPECGAQHTY